MRSSSACPMPVPSSVELPLAARGFLVVLSVLCLTGCVQDSPPSSRERTVSLLLELLHDERPEMRRTAAESLGKIGDPRAADSILPLIQDPASVVREASVMAIGRLKPTATEACGCPVDAGAGRSGRIGPAGGGCGDRRDRARSPIVGACRRLVAIFGCDDSESGGAGIATSRLEPIGSCARRSRT